MQDIRWKQRFTNYQKALKQLESAVNLYNSRDLTELETQGIIQAFEINLELAWKLIKDYLEYSGITDIIGSKNAMRHAVHTGLIEHGQEWIDMIEDRNLSSHTYNEEIALQLAKKIAKNFFIEFLLLKNKFLLLAEKE